MPRTPSGSSRPQRPKYPRPLYVAYICRSLLICAAAGLVVAGLAIFAPPGGVAVDFEPGWLKEAFVALPVLVALCAVFMLRGANWARIVFYIAGSPTLLGILLAMHAHGDGNPEAARNAQMALPAVIIACVFIAAACCIALSMERANWFFAGRKTFFKDKNNRNWGGRRPDQDEADHDYDY